MTFEQFVLPIGFVLFLWIAIWAVFTGEGRSAPSPLRRCTTCDEPLRDHAVCPACGTPTNTPL